MWKIYQKFWHGIRFDSFAKLSSKDMADAEFYTKFYREFFKTHHTWNDLEGEWVELKRQTANFLIERYHLKENDSILSVGCGIGIIEKLLIEQNIRNLECTEVSDQPLQWIKKMLPKEKLHTGFFPECIPPGRKYKLIFLASADYFFTQPELIKILEDAGRLLAPEGRVVLLSWSIAPPGVGNLWKMSLKKIYHYLLEVFGIRHRGQFWGYLRSQREYVSAMKTAGFRNIDQGFFKKNTRWNTYWVDGYFPVGSQHPPEDNPN